MKILINEKQLKLLLSKNIEIDEQEASTDTKQGYPEVGKWESGVTRGPGNQVGITKWSDIVGASLKRGKGNPLK